MKDAKILRRSESDSKASFELGVCDDMPSAVLEFIAADQNHPLVSIVAATSHHATFPSFEFHRLP